MCANEKKPWWSVWPVWNFDGFKDFLVLIIKKTRGKQDEKFPLNLLTKILMMP